MLRRFRKFRLNLLNILNFLNLKNPMQKRISVKDSAPEVFYVE